MGREGADNRTYGLFYVAMVYTVLLYGSNNWVMYLYIGRTMRGLYHRVVHMLLEKHPRRSTDGTWVYPLLAEETVEAGIQEVEAYVAHHQNTAAQKIASRKILELCLAEERCPEKRVSKRWWYQECLDLKRMRLTDQAAKLEEREGEESG